MTNRVRFMFFFIFFIHFVSINLFRFRLIMAGFIFGATLVERIILKIVTVQGNAFIKENNEVKNNTAM